MKRNQLLLISIFAIGFFWRFYHYSERWVFNQDQARDAIISRYLLESGQVPLLGPTSSAGPINFGAAYYYLTTTATAVFPFTAGPWVFFTIISLLIIPVFYLIGKQFGNTKIGLFMATLAAFASVPIIQSSDMLNFSPLIIFVTLALFFALKFLQTKKIIYAFWLSFFIGLSQSFHFQAFGLFALMGIIFFSAPAKIKYFLAVLIGWLIPFIPNFIFDLSHHFAWSTSLLNYYLHGTDKFYIPIRWLTDLRDFWPQLWGKSLTNIPVTGYFFIALFLITLPRLHRYMVPFFLTFIIQIFVLRYYGGTRSPEYLLFVQPFFILFTGYSLAHLSKPLATLIFLLIIITASLSDLKIINQTSQARKIYQLKAALDQNHPGPINFYAQKGSGMASLPIFYLLYRDHRLSPQGTPIGITALGDTYGFQELPNPTASFESYSPKKIYQWTYVNY